MKKVKMFWRFMFVLLISVITMTDIFVFKPVEAAGGMVWNDGVPNDTGQNQYNVSSDALGGRIYYAWVENDGVGDQIWTAYKDTTTDNFVNITKRTNSTNIKLYPDIKAQGTNIYFVWSQRDASNHNQIWTAFVDIDDTNLFTNATQRTSTTGNTYPQIDSDGSKIYFVWEGPAVREVMTAVMDLDGNNWSATQRTSDGYNHRNPRMAISGGKIYFTWLVDSSIPYTIYAASMNTDGTGWVTNILNNESGYRFYPRLVVVGTRIYYVWTEYSPSHVVNHFHELWFGSTNLDGSDYQSQMLWPAVNIYPANYLMNPNLAYYNNKFYFTWQEYDESGNHQLWTADMNDDGTEFRPTQRTDTASTNYLFDEINIDVIDPEIFYSWTENSVGYSQLWTGYETNTATITNPINVTASVPSTLTFTSTAVTSGSACPNSGGTADISTTGNAVNFGIYTGGEDKLGCQLISVSTNATDGYVTTMQINRKLTNSTNDTMDSFAGSSGTADTWAAPEVWTSPVAPNDSYFGWTTDDTSDYTQFSGAKYAAFVANQTPYTVATEPGPVVNQTNYITFRLELGNNQEAGIYTANMMYITTATY